MEQRVVTLVQQALGPAGQVSRSGPGELVVELEAGGAHRFEVIPPDHARVGRPGTVVVLHGLDPAQCERLRQDRLSFVSLRGAVRLEAPGLLLDRGGLSPPRVAGTAPRRSAFSDRASLVARWLFDRSVEASFPISAVAEGAGVSPSVASYAVRDLEAQSVVDVERVGRTRQVRLLSHRGLIESWARAYAWRDNEALAVLAPLASPRRFMSRLRSQVDEHAWTLHGAASLLQPHAVVDQLHLYVPARSPSELRTFAGRHGWVPDPEGSLHLLAPHYRSSLWQGVHAVADIPVVGSAQLIVDLWNYPVRGREQAEVLLEKHVAERA